MARACEHATAFLHFVIEFSNKVWYFFIFHFIMMKYLISQIEIILEH